MENAITCPACNSPSITTTDEAEDFTYRAGGNEYTVHAVIPVHTCTVCGESFLSNAGEDARHRAICKAMNRLTPEDIASLRQRLGMSRKVFAELSGVGEASLARWETGEFVQNESHDNLLRLLFIDENVNSLALIRGIAPAGEASPNVVSNLLVVRPPPERHRATQAVDLTRYTALRPDDERRLTEESEHFKLRRASNG
jgi:putative zinc finger/helix-turn-helix YgiT family protein